MALIECTLGGDTVAVGSENYTFNRDRHGRFVAEVQNLKHVGILTGLPAYRHALPIEPAAPSADPGTDAAEITRLNELCEELVSKLRTSEAALATANAELGTARVRIDILVGELQAANAIIAAPRTTDLDGGHKNTGSEMLLGSSILPSVIEIAANSNIQLGDVVAIAHRESGLTIEDWNALPEVDREAKLQVTVDTLRSAATNPAIVEPDDLTVINGIGKAAAAKLASKGVVSFKQLAGLSAEAMAKLDEELGLNGLSERSQWVDQAKVLADKPAE